MITVKPDMSVSGCKFEVLAKVGACAFLGEGLDTLPAHIAILDQEGIVRYVNRAWRDFADDNGYQGSNYGLGSNYLSVCVATDDGARDLIGALLLVLSGDLPGLRVDYPCHSATEKRWFQMRVVPFEFRGERFFSVSHENITEIKGLQEALALTQQSVDSSVLMTFWCDGEGNILRANQAGLAFLDVAPAAAHGSSILSLAPQLEPFWLEPMRDVDGSVQETCFIGRDGESIPVELRISEVSYEESECRYFILAQDIRERKETEQRIWRLGHIDSGTSLPNLNWTLEQVEQHLAVGDGWLAVLHVDRFHRLYDSLGHERVESLFRQMAQRIGALVQAPALLGRGAEAELILFVPGDEATFHHFLQPLLGASREPYTQGFRDFRLAVTCGFTQADAATGHDGRELLRQTRAAAHEARQRQLDALAFNPGLEDQRRERGEIEIQLRNAVVHNHLQLVYQPQVNALDGRLVGAEALVRWQHEGRTISPGAFIPIAEDSGLIVPVGEWVVAETCRQLQLWREQGLPRLPVAVNVSPRQFNYPDFFQRLVSILDQHRVKPEEIELEITESALMEDLDGRVSRLVANLKQAGFKLAIDDFGTGYSSLAMLHRLPIHKLKIDRSFVVAAEKDEQAASIVQAIISMGQALRVEVLAEGVETSAQRDMLLARHCHLIQGYYYGMPMAANELVRFMAANGQYQSAKRQARTHYIESCAMLQ